MNKPSSVDAILSEAFAGAIWINHAEACRLLDMDPKTLAKAGDEGQIFYRLKGSRRAYTRDDIEAFINGEPPCQSIALDQKTRKPGNGSTRATTITTISRSKSTGKHGGFTVALAKQRSAARRSSSGKSASA